MNIKRFWKATTSLGDHSSYELNVGLVQGVCAKAFGLITLVKAPLLYDHYLRTRYLAAISFTVEYSWACFRSMNEERRLMT